MIDWLFRGKPRSTPWWQHYPVRGCRSPTPRGEGHQPDPRLGPGTRVRLKGNPATVRRVLRAEWHSIRGEFAYIVETSARRFEPYWFAAQLEVVE
jgi:hypothetical protein